MRLLTDELDQLLGKVTRGDTGVPGVVAMVTNASETLYAGAAGHRESGASPMTSDTVFALYSATKAITVTVALQLLETGELQLSAPVREYVPEFATLQVLEGFDRSGQPVLRAPASEATVLQLLTHTSGLGYEFFSDDYARLVRDCGYPRISEASHASLMTPLLFDPGTRWLYGINTDWLGRVIEEITGERLGEVFARRVFGPLGMTDTAFDVEDRLAGRLASIHARESDGSCRPLGARPRRTELHMGGHGLYGTVPDYLRFIRMWLNAGRGEHGQVLRPETVELATRNHLADGVQVTRLPSSVPFLTNDLELFPGLPKSWSLAFMVNEETAPTGRPIHSQGWAGLANLYYWIDRRHGIGGFWATQVLPFVDQVSLGGYLELEKTVYARLRRERTHERDNGSSPPRRMSAG